MIRARLKILALLFFTTSFFLGCAADSTTGQRLFQIEGRWIHDGQPMVNEKVRLIGQGSPVRLETQTDDRGRFAFRGLKAGAYRAVVDLIGPQALMREPGLASVQGGLTYRRVILGPNDSELEIETFPTQIIGTVSNEKWEDQSVAHVSLNPLDTALSSIEGWIRPIDLTDFDGRFEFRGVPPGRYRMVARSQEHHSTWRIVDIEAEPNPSYFDLVVKAPSLFHFKVFAPDKTPADFVHFTLTDDENRRVSASPASRSDDGTFTIQAPEGRWRLWLRGTRDGGTIFREIEVPGRGGPWHLPARGLLRFEGYKYPQALTVRLFDSDGEPYIWPGSRLMDAQQFYVAAISATAGKWRVEVEGPDNYRWSGEVEIPAGGETTVQIPSHLSASADAGPPPQPRQRPN